MSLNLGIVGLPNVGKSTLFNALLSVQQAESANYPFCTIEPNVGKVSVPDERLEKIVAIAKPQKTIPAQIEFVDIAGLVKGASKGEGLGNQFLANIRETDAIIYVLRCFEDADITHVEGTIDPLRDAEIIETELVLADLESLEKRIEGLQRKIRGGDKEAMTSEKLAKEILEIISAGDPARNYEAKDDEEKRLIKHLQLLTSKPCMYVLNVKEDEAQTGNDLTKAVMAKVGEENCVVICAQVEAELAGLEDDEKLEYLDSLGLSESGLNKLIKKGYALLDLITYFTAGEKEVRAWQVRQNSTAPQAAGVIHTDFEKGFIRAETIAYADYIDLGGEAAAKDAGKLRLEGKEYIVADGDIMHFRFNN